MFSIQLFNQKISSLEIYERFTIHYEKNLFQSNFVYVKTKKLVQIKSF